jgi:hypothetical protein
MAFTAADLSNIESAIATGELTVEVDGKRVTYRSMDDLLKARSTIQAALQAAGAASSSPRISYACRVRD